MNRSRSAHEDPGGSPHRASTVTLLRGLGHDVVRVTDVLPATAPDHEIVARALADRRVILTQDLDFSAIVAVSGANGPSVISIRLLSANVDHINTALTRLLPGVAEALESGALVTVEQDRIRTRALPIRD